MANILRFIKKSYNQQAFEPLDEREIFQQDCVERIGKQFMSIMISSSMVKTKTFGSNRDISSSLKRFEELMVKKMKMSNKREVNRIFGKFCLQQIKLIKDFNLIEFELGKIFYEELANVSKSKAEPTPGVSYRRPCRRDDRYMNENQMQNASTVDATESTRSTALNRQYQLSKIRTQYQKFELEKILEKLNANQQNSGPNFRSKIQKLQSTIHEDNFNFEFTQKDLQKKTQDFSCEEFFIDVVGYLLKLPSPQGQLTYIWQHLKWQGFQTFYDAFMNEAFEWKCTARIVFPLGMTTEPYLQRTQKSKNKRKARQLACMDLLKSLYLQYPQVWMLYKHLKQQKRLVIAAVDEPKDEDEIALIKNRNGYNISKQKIQKVFRHNKTDIRQMMEKISSKAELNTLLQQLPGRVTSPKLEKKQVQSNWSVPVRIQYKTYDDIQNNRAPKVYQKTVLFHNTKIAQQEAYMEAIIEMYQQNPDLFEKIQSIKLAKGIKQPQKKLPLMREIKQLHR